MLLGQLVALWGLYFIDQDIAELNFPCVEVHFTDYLIVICFIVLLLIGIHGVYTNDARYLKVVSIKQTTY